ncbi:hypothetical protein GTZ78_36575, partial [Streptomyces sp. SID8361]|nr:hypothetical protein [Streptomyces sp. SID8361]
MSSVVRAGAGPPGPPTRVHGVILVAIPDTGVAVCGVWTTRALTGVAAAAGPDGSGIRPEDSATQPEDSDTRPDGSATQPEGSDTRPGGSATRPEGSDTRVTRAIRRAPVESSGRQVVCASSGGQVGVAACGR